MPPGKPVNISSQTEGFYTAQKACRNPEDPAKPLTYQQARERAMSFLRAGKGHPFRTWTIYLLDEDAWLRGSTPMTGLDKEHRDALLDRICDLTNRAPARVVSSKVVKIRRRA